MARSAARRRTARDEYLDLWEAQPKPPSGALINAILEHADIEHDVGGGRVLLRLSPRRVAERAMRRLLGEEARRLGDVAVLWDEDEGQIAGIVDDGSPSERAFWPCQDINELDTFELTEAALAYIEGF